MTEPPSRDTDAPSAVPRAHPPETAEGWYAFHQILSFDRPALRALGRDERTRLCVDAETALDAATRPEGGGWSAVVPLIGSRGDVMLVHFRPTLDGIAHVQQSLARLELFDLLRPVYSFLSVT